MACAWVQACAYPPSERTSAEESAGAALSLKNDPAQAELPYIGQSMSRSRYRNSISLSLSDNLMAGSLRLPMLFLVRFRLWLSCGGCVRVIEYLYCQKSVKGLVREPFLSYALSVELLNSHIARFGLMKGIHIRTMTTDDLALGLRLSRQAGWNQTEADWLRFMYFEPEGCFVAELDGCAVGTTTTCVLGRVAWIAMVLVDIDARGQGIGTRLLRNALDHLDGRQVPTVRLDATELGRPVYEKLGFAPEYELARYEGIAPSCPTPPTVAEATSESYRGIVKFDKKMTGTDREKMLVRLFAEFPQNLRVSRRQGRIEGYATSRPGANAVQIGPCVAATDAGPALLRDALNRCSGKQVFVDIPLDNAGAVKIAESSGLRIQRSFTRMYRGEKVDDRIEALWASSGAEKG